MCGLTLLIKQVRQSVGTRKAAVLSLTTDGIFEMLVHLLSVFPHIIIEKYNHTITIIKYA